MDDEKFSIDRFLELMGERDAKTPSLPEPRTGRRRDTFFRALRAGIASDSARTRRGRFSAEETGLAEHAGASAPARRFFRGRARDDAAQETTASVMRRSGGEALAREAVGGGADRREVLRAHALRGKPEDEPTSAGEMFHVEHFERGGEKEAIGGEDLRSAEALSDNGSQPVGVFRRLIAKLRGVQMDETAVERARGVVNDDDGRGESADGRVFAGRQDAGAGYDEGEWSDETGARGVRKYRAEEPVWRGETRSVAEVGESAPSGERSRGEKRVFAENHADSTEIRSKTTEFRKSDVSADMDIRAISRAIERDARRY